MKLQFLLVLLLMLTVSGIALSHIDFDDPAQERITATPARITLPSVTPLATVEPVSAATATRTPTPIGPVVLEARTEANVRTQPDPESELLGTIRAGDFYPVLGRFFRWIQFQFDPTLGDQGIGWVFDELITITGDESSIRVLTNETLDDPIGDPQQQAITETAIAITLTPGGILTATAAARSISVPGGSGAGQTNLDLSAGGTALPTFTFPPNIALLAPTERADTGGAAVAAPPVSNAPVPMSERIPPIVPIGILGGLGFLGLLVSLTRR